MSFLRSIFMRPDYKSETTEFINQLKKDKPQLDAEQRAGRALLWDKKVDRAAWSEFRAGEIPQKPYVYLTEPKK